VWLPQCLPPRLHCQQLRRWQHCSAGDRLLH
jgi:hypothetical protein